MIFNTFAFPSSKGEALLGFVLNVVLHFVCGLTVSSEHRRDATDKVMFSMNCAIEESTM